MNKEQKEFMNELAETAWVEYSKDKPYSDERDKKAYVEGFRLAFAGQKIVYEGLLEKMKEEMGARLNVLDKMCRDALGGKEK
jgi:hypothetical protein